MKLLLLVPLFLIIISTPAFAQLSDATGLLYSFDVETGGYSFEIETVSNFDVYDHEYDRDKKRLTLFINSGLENNLGEVTIPHTLLSGNFTFYLNGETYNPILRSNEKISFITLEFEGTGENKIDIIATETFVGEEKQEIPVVDEPETENGGCLIATATYGTELAPQVQQLREIRDQKLMQTESGQSFLKSFNDIYYSFSPAIADLERENPIFKELVKIGITPMISSLSILNHVDMDSETEVLGYGISLILLNVGMYFVAPPIIIMRIRRWDS